MLDLPRMERISLVPRPRFQKIVARVLLMPNYALAGVDVKLEGAEKIPDEPVIYAMNHTDMYNYWPFQLKLWRELGRFTSVWVKGKYFENWLMGRFMEWANCMPAVSRGYLITRDFIEVEGERPSREQYKTLRGAFGRWTDPATDVAIEDLDTSGVPRAIFETPRNMLGRDFDPSRESYFECLEALHRRMTERFVEINEECFDLGLDLIIFPQGTRSITLARGHIGIAEVALRYRKTVVPVGCNGSDLVYPGGSPIAQGGNIVYRIGDPIRWADMREYHIDEDYQPFTPETETKHRDTFQAYVDVVSERINELLDPKYQWGGDESSDGVKGTSRFV